MKWKATYTKSGINLGSKAEWYQRDNAELLRNNNPTRREPDGYYAEIGFYDEMADFRQNSWTGEIVDGPFLNEQDALDAAVAVLEERGDEYDVLHGPARWGWL